jgi:WD40 repeat protein
LPYSYQKEIIQFWNSKTGNLLGKIRIYYGIVNIAFSPDGYLMAVSGDDGIIRLWGVKKTSQ